MTLFMYLLCALMRHPPATSIYWEEGLQQRAIELANRMEREGQKITVSCACGRRKVDPRPSKRLWEWTQRAERHR